MITIRLLDARRGLNLKCRELFKDEKIAEEIYRYLCDGMDECEAVLPERKKGKWKVDYANYRISGKCSACGWEAHRYEDDVVGMPYCPNCGAHMEGAEDDPEES